MLQYAAVCCSMLQYAAVCYGMLLNCFGANVVVLVLGGGGAGALARVVSGGPLGRLSGLAFCSVGWSSLSLSLSPHLAPNSQS